MDKEAVVRGLIREQSKPAHLLLWARKEARFEALKLLRERRRAQVPLEGDVLDLLDAAWLQADGTDLGQETDRPGSHPESGAVAGPADRGI